MDASEVDPGPEGLPRAQLQPLLARRDGPGLVRLGVQLAGIGSTAAATLTIDGPWWLVSVVAMGVLVATLFPPLHEAGHRTAFASRRLGEVTVWLCAFAMLQAPAFFREFHFQHHRSTQDRALDPEIAAAPGLLADWPRNPLVWLMLVSGVPIMLGKAMFTLVCALAPRSVVVKQFPFIRASACHRIASESRLVVLLWAGLLALGLAFVPHFARLLLAWPVAHLVLGFYLMAEHTGLPHDGTQQHRTRSITSNALVRWFMWNMPLHAVHHMHPAIPFFAVPTAHRLLAPALEHTCPGYLAFHREALAHAFGRRSTAAPRASTP